MNAVKNNYIERSDCENLLVITSSNADRHVLNNSIRTALKQKGIIQDKEYQSLIRVPKSLPGTRRYFAANFQKGQTIYFENRTYPSGIEAEIDHVDKENNQLNIVTLNGKDGVVKLRDIHTKISLYDKQVRNFSIGERVVFLKNDNRLNVRNGMTGTLKHIDEKGALHIKLDFSGKTLRFNQSEYNYLDHGYVSTVHKSQGMTAKDVIFVASTENPQLNNTESFYVAATRAKSSFQLFTNDLQIKNQFMASLEKTSTISEKMFKHPMEILLNTKELEK
jgi:ATP-dependent exoDNAse (exonuclease V) alpha subunit